MRLPAYPVLTSLLLLTVSAPVFAAMPHIHRGPTSPKLSRSFSKSHTASHASLSHSGPTGIAPERATQIQTALIKSGYMTGEPSGVWDSSTQAAMVKMQSENGWQTKLVPDSRAIIKLGLGPGSTPPAEPSSFGASAPSSERGPTSNQ